MWAALVILGTVAGLTIAGMPELGAGPNPVQVATETTDTTTTTTTTSTTLPARSTTTAEATTTTQAPPAPRATTEVTVLVANGTQVPGAAGRLTDLLAEHGHPTLTPITISAFDVSELWFVDDFGPEAAVLAERLGVFPENVRRVPDDPGFAVGEADVIAIVGPELADVGALDQIAPADGEAAEDPVDGDAGE